ncbi:MAG: hypothetical protein JWQ44_1776 [Chthoniobacter sp.]|nr:hypothetical protein [Chthoniobacter sp.]
MRAASGTRYGKGYSVRGINIRLIIKLATDMPCLCHASFEVSSSGFTEKTFDEGLAVTYSGFPAAFYYATHRAFA